MNQGPRPLGSSHHVMRSAQGAKQPATKQKGSDPKKRASPSSAALESVVQHRPPPPRRQSEPPPVIQGLYAPGSRASTPPPPIPEEERVRLEAVRATVALERQKLAPPQPRAKPSRTASTKVKVKKEPADREHPDYGATTKLSRREMREQHNAKVAAKKAEEAAAEAAAASAAEEEPPSSDVRGAARKLPYVRHKPSNGAPVCSSR